MKNKLLSLSLLIFFGAIVFIFPSTSLAQRTDLDISIKPAITYLDVQPNQPKTYPIIITHDGSIPLNVNTQVVEFAPDQETGRPILDLESNIYFVSFKDDQGQPVHELKMLPHSQKQLIVEINPPLDAVQKEYHLSLLFKTESANQNQAMTQTGSITSAIVASNLIASVSNQEITGGPLAIHQIKMSSIFDSFQPLKFTINVQNAGQKATTATGKVKISNWTNQELANYTLAPTVVLGESSRNLRYLVNGSESGETTEEFIYDQPFILGPLTVEVELISPNEQINTLILQKKALALPISLLIFLLFALALYILVIYLRTHKSLLPSLKKSFNLNSKHI